MWTLTANSNPFYTLNNFVGDLEEGLTSHPKKWVDTRQKGGAGKVTRVTGVPTWLDMGARAHTHIAHTIKEQNIYYN